MKVIVPLGIKADYINARRLAEFKGMKLPPHALHDDYLARSERWKTLRNYKRVCSREMLVYPESRGEFREGTDVIDTESGWIFPASYVSKAAETGQVFNTRKVALFVDPEAVETGGGKVVIHPASITVLHGMLQNSGFSAKVDELTRLPLTGTEPMPDDELRCIWRTKGIGVRPIIRCVSNCTNQQRFNQVFTDHLPDELFDVTFVMDW